MTISEIIKIARRDSNILFTREFHKQTGFDPKQDVYRVNIKGRLNMAFEEYDPYNSVALHTDHLVADDWVIYEK